MLDFNQIHNNFFNKVLRHLKSIIGEQAEDCAQEVFIKIHNGLDGLKDESKLSSWIYSITLNTAKDALRTIKAKEKLIPLENTSWKYDAEDRPLQTRIPVFHDKAYEEIVQKKKMYRCYVDIVERLPPNYYEIYSLSEFEELSNIEIAQKLSLSIETVKIRLHRARTKLYEELRNNCSCYCDSSGDLMCEPKS